MFYSTFKVFKILTIDNINLYFKNNSQNYNNMYSFSSKSPIIQDIKLFNALLDYINEIKYVYADRYSSL